MRILASISFLDLHVWLLTNFVDIFFQTIEKVLHEFHRVLLAIACELLRELTNLPLKISGSDLGILTTALPAPQNMTSSDHMTATMEMAEFPRARPL